MLSCLDISLMQLNVQSFSFWFPCMLHYIGNYSYIYIYIYITQFIIRYIYYNYIIKQTSNTFSKWVLFLYKVEFSLPIKVYLFCQTKSCQITTFIRYELRRDKLRIIYPRQCFKKECIYRTHSLQFRPFLFCEFPSDCQKHKLTVYKIICTMLCLKMLFRASFNLYQKDIYFDPIKLQQERLATSSFSCVKHGFDINMQWISHDWRQNSIHCRSPYNLNNC